MLEYSDAGMFYTYRIVESPLPLTDYASTMTLRAGPGGGTIVEWTGSFKRRSTLDNPPAGEDDASLVKLIDGAYQGGLENVRKLVEGK